LCQVVVAPPESRKPRTNVQHEFSSEEVVVT